jgi:hypothetical protein
MFEMLGSRGWAALAILFAACGLAGIAKGTIQGDYFQVVFSFVAAAAFCGKCLEARQQLLARKQADARRGGQV